MGAKGSGHVGGGKTRPGSDSGRDVERLLDTVAGVTGLGVVYHAQSEPYRSMHGEVCAFCGWALAQPELAQLCRAVCRQAAHQSWMLGEPYFHRCWAELAVVTVAIVHNGVCRGGVSIGGFRYAGEAHDAQQAVRHHLAGQSTTLRRTGLAHLAAVRDSTPAAMRGLGAFLLEAAFSSGANAADAFRAQNEKYRQQREIADSLNELARLPGGDADLLGDAYRLADALPHADPDQVRHLLAGYFARLLGSGNWNLVTLKAHARVLLAALTCRDVQRGEAWPVALGREAGRLQRIEQTASLEDCCYELTHILAERARHAADLAERTATVTERLYRWVALHSGEPVTLADMARGVGASVSSLRQHLRRDQGKTPHQVLAEARVDTARRLLATTKLGLSEIAAMCGFADQSHFTKVLKAAINLTPGQFRKLLNFGHADI